MTNAGAFLFLNSAENLQYGLKQKGNTAIGTVKASRQVKLQHEPRSKNLNKRAMQALIRSPEFDDTNCFTLSHLVAK